MRPNNWLAGATAAAMVIALGTVSEQAIAQTESDGSEIVNPFKDSATGVKISEAGVLYSEGKADGAVTGGYSLKLDAGSNGNVVIADTDGSPVLTTQPKGTVYADLPPGRYQISGDGDSCQQVAITAGGSQQSVSLGSSSECGASASSATASASAGASTSSSTASAAAPAPEPAKEDPVKAATTAAASGQSSAAATSSSASGSGSASTASASSSAPTRAASRPKPQPKPKPRVLKFYDRDKVNPPGVDIETQTSDAGVEFVTGGIGRRETAYMQSEFGNYSFMLTNTATSDGRKAHVADVDVVISNASGEEVLKAKTLGPWLLAQLSPGKYKMVTHFENNSEEHSFVVGRSGQKKIDIHWPQADLGLDK